MDRRFEEKVVEADQAGWKFYGAVTLHVLDRFWYELRRTLLAVHPLPLLAAFLMAYLLSEVGQVRELYIDNVERMRNWGEGRNVWAIAHTSFALGSLLLFSVLVFIANNGLGTHRVRSTFVDRYASVSDPRLSGWVRTSGVFAALLPWIGLVSGFAQAVRTAREHIENIAGIEGAKAGVGGYFDASAGTLTEFGWWLRILDRMPWEWNAVPLFWQLVGACAMAAVVLGLFGQIMVELRASRVRMKAPHLLGGAALPSTPDYMKQAWNRMSDARKRFWRVTFRSAALGVRSVTVLMIVLLVVGNFLIPPMVEMFGRPELGRTATEHMAYRLEQLNVPSQSAEWIGRTWSGWAALGKVWPWSWLPTPIGAWAVTSGVLFLLPGAFFFFKKSRLGRQRWSPAASTVLMVVKYVSFAVFLAAVVSGFVEFYWVDISRAFGPLATVILVSLVLLAALTGLCHLARQTELPFFLVLVATGTLILLNKLEFSTELTWCAVILAGLGLVALMIRKRMGGWVMLAIAATALFGAAKHSTMAVSTQSAAGTEKQKLAKVDVAFEQWLDKRKPAAFKEKYGKPYPVFIIAAEGGGIYAAAATATFLARMQDRCPVFAQHVFAISAVSGGAVGATVFHGAVSESKRRLVETAAEEHCLASGNASRQGAVEEKVAAVLKEDHLSPIVGLIVPDLVGVYSDRAQGLEDSLVLSMDKYINPVKKRGAWSNSYSSHWSAESPAPALVLNTTAVRGGNRVVFAPFELDRSRFVSLATFESLAADNKWQKGQNDIKLAEAAVVSARFPGIVAAFEMRSAAQRGEAGQDSEAKQRRWHYVDGGYVDASGAITAREIYESIKGSKRAGEIDLRVILLTSTQSQANDDGGTDRAEPAAPVVTLFQVRSLLSRIAVRETINNLTRKPDEQREAANPVPRDVELIARLEHPSQLGKPYAEDGSGWPVSIIELNHEDFKLALGWKISRLTFEIVSQQMGEADRCVGLDLNKAVWQGRGQNVEPTRSRSEEQKKEGSDQVARTIRANSCVMASIEKLLTGKSQ